MWRKSGELSPVTLTQDTRRHRGIFASQDFLPMTNKNELIAEANALRAKAGHLRVLRESVTDDRALTAIRDLISELEGRAKALQIRAGDGESF